jgi:hypothetical protein
MITYIEMNKRTFYCSPKIERIMLDNNISLAMESSPPEGPDEVLRMQQEYFNPNSYKTDIV